MEISDDLMEKFYFDYESSLVIATENYFGSIPGGELYVLCDLGRPLLPGIIEIET